MSSPGTDISRLAEHLFRHESGKLVSVLTGIFGTDRLQLAEDVVQEALLRAFQTWPYYGIPKNPAAWLTQTAKNLALDVVRREKLFSEKQPQIIAFIEHWTTECDPEESPAFENEIRDRRLQLMFACCHPAIPQEAQVALALKTLGGFGTAEMASAFLSSEAAIAKRLTRARERIRELQIPLEIPSGADLPARLDAVLQTLYLMFNEGYKASSGDKLIREELCREAIRLVTLLSRHEVGDQPRVHALAALMFLNTARLPARVDDAGNILRLKDQDRSCWNRSLIARGMFHFMRSAEGKEITAYHLQAGIAACHCAAPAYEQTDWARILSLYDHLVELDDSPVIALNRAVAVAQVHGAEAGLQAIAGMRHRAELESYCLFYAVLAEFEWQLNRPDAAAEQLRQALRLTNIPSEQTLLRQRLKECEDSAVPCETMV